MTYRCPVCRSTSPGERCTKDDCGFTPESDPKETARKGLAAARARLDKGHPVTGHLEAIPWKDRTPTQQANVVLSAIPPNDCDDLAAYDAAIDECERLGVLLAEAKREAEHPVG